MRQLLGCVLLPVGLGACSLLYNPSNIDSQRDAPVIPIDAPFDGDPAMLMLDHARPATLLEGQGAGGSRAAILVIDGTNIVKENTIVTLTPMAGATKTPMVVVDNTRLETSADGRYLSVPVTLPVDKLGLVAGDAIKLDVKVEQDGPAGRISKTLIGAITIKGLSEIDGAVPAGGFAGGAPNLYSLVNITSGSVGPAAGATEPIIIRSTSSLSIGAGLAISVNATTTVGGPGGGAGGAGGAGTVTGVSVGGPGGGPAGGTTSGQGGGFSADTFVPTLGTPQRGSGGAGGPGSTLSAGMNGGGGGGSIELTADGDLVVGAVQAKGAAPSGNGNPAGGGSGGVILLRAGGTLTATSLDVSGATNGAAGHARHDAGGTATVGTANGAFRGPMFVAPPLFTTDARPTIMIAGKPLSSLRYFIQNDTGSMIRGPLTASIPASGLGELGWGALDTEALFPGLNQLCLVVATGDNSSDTANCTSLAWVAR